MPFNFDSKEYKTNKSYGNPIDEGNENRLKVGKSTSLPVTLIGIKQRIAPIKPINIASFAQLFFYYRLDLFHLF